MDFRDACLNYYVHLVKENKVMVVNENALQIVGKHLYQLDNKFITGDYLKSLMTLVVVLI